MSQSPGGPITGSQLNRRITIQARQDTPDGQLGVRIAWANVATNVAAKITYPPPSKKGDEVFTQGQVRSSIFATMTIRYRPSQNISAAMRVVYGTRVFNIRTVYVNDEARRYITMQCEELQSTGTSHT
jgi:SPP1 family predicted phage head-tail adaptor